MFATPAVRENSCVTVLNICQSLSGNKEMIFKLSLEGWGAG